MIPFDAILELLCCHLQCFYYKVLELRVLSKLASTCIVLTLSLIVAPDLVSDSWRIHAIIFFSKERILRKVEVWQMLVVCELIEYFGFLSLFLVLIAIEHFLKILFAARMMLISSPIGVKLVANLAVFLLLISLLHKWMLEQFRPAQTLRGCLVEKSLEEGFELG